MAMDCKDGESPGPRLKDKTLPGHDIFCTPENSNFLSAAPYETLDPTQREIRVLKVLPDSGSGFVACELLPSAPIAQLRGKYLALSYCAGSPRNTEIILVNGVKCNVFANLRHALTCARHFWTAQPGNGDFLLWADQICINQADLSERSHQVGFMRDIYESAQQTLVCLSTSDTQGKAMEWLVENLSESRARWEYGGAISTKNYERRMAIWEQIIESPWWSRAWVLQEFVVSADVTFLSGYSQMSLTKVLVALQPFIGPGSNMTRVFPLESISKRGQPNLDASDMDYHVRLSEEVARKVWFMLETKAEWRDFNTLSSILAHSRNSKASDDRDLIYAFIGLANPGYGITPDYSADITLCDVLTQTTRNIVLFENSFEVLVLNSSYLARRPELPSWVVDWTRGESLGRSHTQYPVRDRFGSHFQKDGQAIASFRETIHPETLQKTTVMEVTGIFVKEIQYVDRPYYGLPYTKDAILKEKGVSVGPDGRGWTQPRHGYEAWRLCESPCDLVLQRESYGHRLIRWLSPAHSPPTFARFEPQGSERRVISIF